MENEYFEVLSLSINPNHYPLDFLKKYFNITSKTKKEFRQKIFQNKLGYPSKHDVIEDEVKINDIIFNKNGLNYVKKCLIDWNKQINRNSNHGNNNNKEEKKKKKSDCLIICATLLFYANPDISEDLFTQLIKVFIKKAEVNLPSEYKDLNEFYFYIKNINESEENKLSE